MTTPARRVHVLHAPDGRVLAVVSASEQASGGLRTGARPVPAPGQLACEIELSQEQSALPSEELVGLEVHVGASTGRPALRRRER